MLCNALFCKYVGYCIISFENHECFKICAAYLSLARILNVNSLMPKSPSLYPFFLEHKWIPSMPTHHLNFYSTLPNIYRA